MFVPPSANILSTFVLIGGALRVLGIYPRGNHRDDDIMIVSMTYIMSSMNIHYRQTCID